MTQAYDWSIQLLVDKDQEQELALDFLSMIDSLIILGSELLDPGSIPYFIGG